MRSNALGIFLVRISMIEAHNKVRDASETCISSKTTLEDTKKRNFDYFETSRAVDIFISWYMASRSKSNPVKSAA